MGKSRKTHYKEMKTAQLNTTRIIFTLAGVAAGLIYYEFYGCSNGCMITSVWWRSGIYGGIMGYLIGGILKDYFLSKSGQNQ